MNTKKTKVSERIAECTNCQALLANAKSAVKKAHVRKVQSWNKLATFESSTEQRAKENQYAMNADTYNLRVSELIETAKMLRHRHGTGALRNLAHAG